MKVAINQELCTGSAICAYDLPEVFIFFDEKAFVKTAAAEPGEPESDGMKDGQPIFKGVLDLADVPLYLEDDVIRIAKACPGECILIQRDEE
jgi:ferredoxin